MTTLSIPFSLPGCRIDQVHADHEHLELHGSTTRESAVCPTCDQVSRTIHSSYTRMLRDLPIATWCVRLLLTVRRFRCPNAACPRRTFVEPLTDLAPAFARRTARLTSLLTHMALLLGGQAGHRLAQSMRTPISRDSLLRIIRRMDLPAILSPTVIGIDDWALAKGRSYATIVVDLERHQPISLLPDRSATTMISWLAAHPSVEAITRDRSPEYARAAAEGAPQARQIADRWHLLQNLREGVERLLQRLRLGIGSKAVDVQKGPIQPPRSDAAMRPRRLRPLSTSEHHRQEASQLRRVSRFEMVHELLARGLSRSAVARLLGLSRTTVHTYAQAKEPPERAQRPPQASILDPYLPYLQERWLAGCTNAQQLWRELRDRGYGGGSGQVRRWAQHQRHDPALTTPKHNGMSSRRVEQQMVMPGTAVRQHRLEAGSPRQASWLLMRGKDDLTEEEQAAVRGLLHHPTVVAAHDLVDRFQRMVRKRQPDDIDRWLADVTESGIPELANFALGLRRDEEAVRNALREVWSQGQTEGQITRLKLIRRQMYGRGKLDLLSRRVLAAA